jgi:hypothetical protein
MDIHLNARHPMTWRASARPYVQPLLARAERCGESDAPRLRGQVEAAQVEFESNI